MRAVACLILTIAILLAELVPVGVRCVDTVQAYEEVNSTIITSDTTWIKANSPYELKGPLAIDKDVTLTIAPGVQVFFNSHYMQVNGTLVARGNNNEPISFLTGEGHTSEIIFMPTSKSWNEQTHTGSIIEKVNTPSNSFKITINGVSPKIASSISQAMITINNGSPQIDSNQFSGHITSITVINGAPIISNNRLSSFKIIITNGSPVIIRNVITGFPIMKEGSLVGHAGTCIEASGGTPCISNNNITGCYTAIQIGNAVIQNNTLSGGRVITVVGSSSPMIKYNNIFGGSPKMFLSEGASKDIDATYNWWDTTDEAIIRGSIVDKTDDFNLGTVDFVPYLSEPNPQAMPDPNAPIPTPNSTTAPSNAPTSTPETTASPSQNPTLTPNKPVSGGSVLFGLDWLGLVIVVLLLVVVVLLVLVVVFLHKRSVW